jgi:hypothetical protein
LLVILQNKKLPTFILFSNISRFWWLISAEG